MGNTMTWQETASISLAQLAIALQPHHKAKLDDGECFALACLLRQQLASRPGNVVETAILSDLIERMEAKQVVYAAIVPATHRAQHLSAVPA